MRPGGCPRQDGALLLYPDSQVGRVGGVVLRVIHILQSLFAACLGIIKHKRWYNGLSPRKREQMQRWPAVLGLILWCW
jgi:hypothetical protein